MYRQMEKHLKFLSVRERKKGLRACLSSPYPLYCILPLLHRMKKKESIDKKCSYRSRIYINALDEIDILFFVIL